MRKNIRRKLVVLVGIIFGVTIFTACGSQGKQQSYEAIKKRGELIIGVDDTFVPMGFRDEQDKLVGFDIDLANVVTKELGLKAKIQPIDWSLKESELKNGTIDVIWNGYTVTDARKKQVDFSNYYLKNEQVLVVRKDSGIKDLAQMKDKVVGLQEGSSGQESFDKKPELLKNNVKNQEAVLFPSFTEAFIDLKAKRIDGLVIDKVFAEYYVSKQEDQVDYIILPTDFAEEDFAVGVAKDNKELVEVINTGLEKAIKDGQAQKISEKWFGDDRILK
ncbi:amino acid ABC transporter substrate-binding protein [Vagococcus vulneris]|uniref:Amino acid ABC transporter substrate-binding protein n=1 Tax=Vagococcus vulneris TaxID=1977869 RepID=A0A430A2B7_9ENTE|nr:amino acid ABC transporter substrate-binding protein [Vagococcus vulneris]RSU00580.1 amino acid ABC transporter substrate-binding protein [Vagococcus vulneris]